MRAAVMESKNIKTDKAKSFSFVHFVAAIGGIVAGLILMAAGLILSAISFFTQINFDVWEMFLIVSAFVFLTIGAHFLDLIDREKKARKKQKLNL